MAALDLIVATASHYHAAVAERAPTAATFTVRPPLPSERPGPAYLIQVKESPDGASARELVPTRMPAFCPERHINLDGTFCLNWAEEDPLPLRDDADAEAWWETVLAFLERQRQAGILRYWPARNEARAHGSHAARWQSTAERLATSLGSSFQRRLYEGRFRLVRRTLHGQPRVRLLADGRRMCTLIPVDMRIMTVRSRCPCDRNAKVGLPLRSCGDHVAALANFVIALHEKEREERLFFDEIRAKKHVCCGTLDDCPLAAGRSI